MPHLTANNPTARACLSCRSKHLKCDAKQPICDRCTTYQLECIYVKSKRGYVGGRGRHTRQQLNSPAQSSDDHPSASAPSLHSWSSLSTDGLSDSPAMGSDRTTNIVNQTIPDLHDERTFHLYYRHIHPAHPFLIPYQLFREDSGIIAMCVKHAIQFVAKPLYKSSPWDPSDFERIYDICTATSPDGFQVQALLLLTIAAYAHGERVQGEKAIRQAIKTARQIGLDSNEFDAGYSPMLRESWRRTWWELYSIYGVLRVLTPAMSRLQASYTRLTPCHEAEYESCQPLPSRSLNKMQQRHFAEDYFQYSAFAYRIEAVRILNEILDFTNQDSQELQSFSVFNAHRAAVRSYLLSLPILPQNIENSTHATDELMFCARTIINMASILLNLPRSSLSTIHSFNTICQTKRATAFNYDQNCTVAAIGAADSIVQLLVDRSTESMNSTSPCFSCMLSFATTVHLLAYNSSQDQERGRTLREYVQVSLGALNATGQIWPVARIVKSQLAKITRELFVSPEIDLPQTQARQKDWSGIEPPEPILDIRDDQWLRDFVDNELSLHLPA